MKILGVEFAPVLIPLSRRLQTLAALTFSFLFIFAGPVSVLVGILLLFTPLNFIPLLYLVWYYFDRNSCHRGGRRIEIWRSSPIYKYLRDYFPVSLVKTAELDPAKNYVFGFHPHGVMSVGAACVFLSNFLDFETKFPGIKASLLVLSGWFRLPITREALLASGACSVTKESIDYALSEGAGRSVVIPVGGAAEVLEANPNTANIVIKNRKGFVKRAIVNGASLVPIFSFGENELFSMFHSTPGSLLRSAQNLLKKLIGVYIPVIQGRGVLQYNFGIVPYRKPITVVVGKPIAVTKTKEPSSEEVDKVHGQYLSALEQLFEENKALYGFKDVKIQFV